MQEIYNKLTELIKENENIYIMTHSNPDFDGMGSSIGLQQIINKFKKQSYIVRNSNNTNKQLNKAYKYLIDKDIEHNFINKTDALKNINEDTLLIILDTQKEQLLELPELLTKTKKVIIIDHHIKSKQNIQNYIFNYINSNLSSIVEFMTGYMKYLNFEPYSIISTIMLVGLEIDTNNFKFKTTEITYDSAAFLTRMGADSTIKQELLQEDKTNYLKRLKLIENSYMINESLIICVADEEIYNGTDLALVAQKLLQFENVEASFVIGYIAQDIIGISARSIGTIDVEKIMSKMGGGGHVYEAATQVYNSSLESVKTLLISIIGG